MFPDEPAVQLVGKNKEIVPLKGMKVDASVTDLLAEVKVKMRFENEGTNPIEATLRFANENASVHDFRVEIGGKTILAKCQPKAEAAATYDDGISSGHGAFLLEQSKHEEFSLAVGNLLPNTACTVQISYVQELEMEENNIKFELPITNSFSAKSSTIGKQTIASYQDFSSFPSLFVNSLLFEK